ncbi:1-pyrroline-5-carboxylate dehydrogenase, partial [Coemansia furcata]
MQSNLALEFAPGGNTMLWKPPNSAVLSNYVAYDIMREVGVPDGVMRFVPGDAVAMTNQGFEHPEFALLHFTGSTHVFRNMWRQIAENIDRYKSYPRIVGETGGKNYHLVHSSANMENAVNGTYPRCVRVPGPKVLGMLAPLRAQEHVERVPREAGRRHRVDQDGSHHRPNQLHGPSHQPGCLRQDHQL